MRIEDRSGGIIVLLLWGFGVVANVLLPGCGGENVVLLPTTMERTEQVQGPRLALLIGNFGYKRAPLQGPENDVEAIAEVLMAAQFEHVEVLKNATRAEIITGMRGLVARASEQSGIVFFYYSGHALQFRGENYLVPTDVELHDEGEIDIYAVNLDVLLSEIATAENLPLSIVVLDACRDNPFGENVKSTKVGLASIAAPAGTFIAFAASPGQIALDGERLSPYTESLVAQMKMHGLLIEQVFKRAREDVTRRTQLRQTPWDHTSVIGDFYLFPPPPQQAHYTVQSCPASIADTAASFFDSQVKLKLPTGILAADMVQSEYWLTVLDRQAYAPPCNPEGYHAPIHHISILRLGVHEEVLDLTALHKDILVRGGYDGYVTEKSIVNANGGRIVFYNPSTRDGELPTRAMMKTVIHNDYAYVLLLESRVEFWEVLEPTFRAVCKSMILGKDTVHLRGDYVTLTEEIFFSGSIIQPRSEQLIQDIARNYMSWNPFEVLDFVVYVNNEGEDQKIAKERAQAIVDMLVALGVPSRMLQAHGVGGGRVNDQLRIYDRLPGDPSPNYEH